jgi:glycosyltransferase involved in cell wall biosynthesis
MVPTPPMIDPVLERVNHVSSSNLPALAALERDPDDVPLIVFVGRITEEKGVNTVVRALARLRDEHGITARYELAGPVDDADPQVVQRAAAAAGVTDAVVVHPPLDTAGVARLLARAHVQVVPSIWKEPYPIVSIEAATARVPLVATDVGGIPEFIRDGVDGLLYPADDDAALARALARTLADPVETAARVASARERATSHQWDTYLDGMEQFAVDALRALREP